MQSNNLKPKKQNTLHNVNKFCSQSIDQSINQFSFDKKPKHVEAAGGLMWTFVNIPQSLLKKNLANFTELQESIKIN